jgi:UDP-2-acetamido-3-amino-2,3-dideoxy-glucuronate N-acetyltransferase
MKTDFCGAIVHRLADVATTDVGDGTRIWQFVVVLAGARIGADCNICTHVFIENDVVIGDRVTVKCGVQLWDGLRVGDDVFIGPNATFTNDKYPRSKVRPDRFLETVIEAGASIGAGAVILPGLTIGSGALVAAGSVVTRNVAPGTLVSGNPARLVRLLER